MSNDHDLLKFKTDIGINATIERSKMGGEAASIPNRQLIDIGLTTLPNAEKYLKNFKYFGSAAVHIYFNETLRQLTFVSQTNALDLYKCPQPLAAKAFDDLLGEMKTMYGTRRGKLRSGF